LDKEVLNNNLSHSLYRATSGNLRVTKSVFTLLGAPGQKIKDLSRFIDFI